VSAFWIPVLVTCAGCYALKAVGLWVPQRWLQHHRAADAIALLPVALLASLATSQTLASGQHLTIDSRLAGVGVATLAAVLRAPFLVVIVLAAGITAALRLLGLP
jgi:hypothetical protein